MISIHGLNVAWPGFALKDIDLDVPSGECISLVGPTGSGKTLLLETIAGLHRPKTGTILSNDENITNSQPEDRHVAMVYQDCALFPHLSVAENVVFGLRRIQAPGERLRKRLVEVSALVGIEHLLKRKPRQLSGGEKQRVAIARALAVEPGLLLLDEPLSSVDPNTAESLLEEFLRVRRATNLTTIHVTHNIVEAVRLSNHISVISDGRIVQTGTPDQILRRPVSEYVARFTMTRNILSGHFVRKENNLSVYDVSGIEVASKTYLPSAAHVCVRPEDIKLVPVSGTGGTSLSHAGTISYVEDRGSEFLVCVSGPPTFACYVSHSLFMELGLKTGDRVAIAPNPNYVHVF